MGLRRFHNRKRTRGMAMVEMVFVLPLLLLLVFAIAQFGLMFSRWLTLSNAVREGARAGVAWRGPSCDETKVEDDVTETTKAYAEAGGIQWDNVKFKVEGVCAGAGEPLDVSAEYNFKMTIPYANVGSAGIIPISYKASMRNEL